MKIILNLKKIRFQKRISQNELSKISGLSQSLISNIEKSKKSPTLVTLEKIMNALDVQLYELIQIEEDDQQ